MPKKSNIAAKALQAHKKLAGKVEVVSKPRVRDASDLSIYYTPGVGAVSSYLGEHKNEARNYTIKKNTIAIVSDGSAVLGLGNIGPEGALPVMEGKAMLFKELAGINGFPIVLNTQDTEEIIRTVKNIAPVFGGINLEDISAPRCYEIEERLKAELDIPVLHDDQHATALVVLAGLINALKVTGRQPADVKAVISGAGAAGSATAKILHEYGVGEIILVDSRGIISKKRKDLDKYKKQWLKITNPKNIDGDFARAVAGADVLIGLSKAGAVSPEHVASMNKKAIIFAMANPVPEIMPDVARAAGAAVVATGRSDFPNQINNVLAFPGIFAGALKNNVREITLKMRVQAAKNLAALVKRPTANYIIPSVFDKGVIKAISSAIK